MSRSTCPACTKPVKPFGPLTPMPSGFTDQVVVCKCGWVGVRSESPKQEDAMIGNLNFTVDKIAEMATWQFFEGFTSATCGGCHKSANVPIGAGWFCECGQYNVLPWHSYQIPYDTPDMGPSRSDIQAGYAKAKQAKA